MPIAPGWGWLGLQDQLTPEQQEEAGRVDTIEPLKEWLDTRIVARQTARRKADREQSEAVLAARGTLEGYDG